SSAGGREAACPFPTCPGTWYLTMSALECRDLGELPERAGQAESVEDRLALVAAARQPVRRETVAPPRLRQLAELARRDRRSRVEPAVGEPQVDVLLRPEEVDRVSGEDDVVPPARGPDLQVHRHAVRHSTPPPHLD